MAFCSPVQRSRIGTPVPKTSTSAEIDALLSRIGVEILVQFLGQSYEGQYQLGKLG